MKTPQELTEAAVKLREKFRRSIVLSQETSVAAYIFTEHPIEMTKYRIHIIDVGTVNEKNTLEECVAASHALMKPGSIRKEIEKLDTERARLESQLKEIENGKATAE